MVLRIYPGTQILQHSRQRLKKVFVSNFDLNVTLDGKSVKQARVSWALLKMLTPEISIFVIIIKEFLGHLIQ